MTLTSEQVWEALAEVGDPEIPVVSLVEMGIVRDVAASADGVTVSITPTFAGCPALDVMRVEIVDRLTALGARRVEVKLVLAPPWTSDAITPAGRAKLKAFGLAPPPVHGGNVTLYFPEEVACPYCGSTNTRMTNPFGPTLCRAIYLCRNCNQPFEQFKAL